MIARSQAAHLASPPGLRTIGSMWLLPTSLLALLASPVLPSGPLDGDHRSLAASVRYDEMERFLLDAARPGLVEVTVEGRSLQGRAIYLARLKRGAAPARWRVLFYAQQHGDELAGKDAQLFLLRDVLRRPERLPEDTEVWLMPSLNPDGGEAGTRRNAAGADLNRDHQALSQPETQALYRVVRRVRPHVAVDCHEFTRDGEAWRRRGFIKWPIITMDTANHPLLDPALVRAGERWVAEAAAPLARAGHAFERYWVGGPPPDEEQRHSAFDADDGRNGVALHGGLSFIIESGGRWSAPDPQADLGQRVDAYLGLLWRFVEERGHRAQDLAAIDAAQRRPLPAFLPVNVLWGSLGLRPRAVKVIESASGRTREVTTPNFMSDVVVKRSVAAPQAYAVTGAAAPAFRALLERHALAFDELQAPQAVTAERCRLLRVEEQEDPVYARYAGRQVVERQPAGLLELPAGTLLVRLEGPDATRAAALLEPTALYGLYALPEYRKLAGEDGLLPVLRVLAGPVAR